VNGYCKKGRNVSVEKLAIEGGGKAVGLLGPFPSKIGKEELLEIVSMWQFSPQTQRKLKELIENEPEVAGPHLFRYYNPRPSKVAAAEAAMRELIGAGYCLAVNSCTSALVASYRALGIGAGDEVIVPGYTFFATGATVAGANAIPVIVDVDDSLNMDPDAVRKAITKRTKAIVPVHMRGSPAQMDAIMDIARQKGIPVVEDVAQAAGGSFGGKRLAALARWVASASIITRSSSAARAGSSPRTTSGSTLAPRAGTTAPPAGGPTASPKSGKRASCSAVRTIE